jgi:glutamine phosphoribosylpyrophosphate amidotransferase
VKEAVLLSYTPPIGIIGSDGVPRGCMFGVDMPPVENEDHKFIARDGMRNRTIDEISKLIGMRVMYLSVEGMLEVFEELGMPRENLCTYCIGGEHPFNGLEKRVNLSIGATG